MEVKRIFFSSRITRSILLTVVSSFICSTVFANTIPDAGFMLESIKNNELPFERGRYPSLIIDEKVGPKEKSDHSTIKISKFLINNKHIPFKENELGHINKILNDALGQEATLEDLEDLADKISQYLQKQGYLVGFAYVPVQEIKDGVVEIAILVGQYDKVQLHNTSKLSDSKIKGILSCLHSGDVIKEDLLNVTLLTLHDMPGISVKATLVPGSLSGTSDLIIDIVDGKQLTAAVYIDNHNNTFTGREHVGASIRYNNISGNGDDITINGAVGSRLTNFGAVYSVPSGNHGERFGLGYSHMDYSLGGKFADLSATGKGKVINFYHTTPLLRSRAANLNLRIGYEKKQLQDQQVGSAKAKQSAIFSVGLSGGSYDQLGGGGATNYAITFYRGKLDLLNSVDEMSTALGTGGTFNKYTFEFGRQQYMNQRLSAILTFVGQTANKNLDSSEKFFLGGAAGVRAYPEGEAAGDIGYKVTGELRWSFPRGNKSKEEWALIGFVDMGHVRINKNNLPGAGINGRTLAGAGLGISWTKADEYSVRLDYAWKLGNEQAVSDQDAKGRVWARVIKYF